MQNPYEKYDAHRSETRFGHGTAWAFTFVFLLLCTLAPFWQNVKEIALGPAGWTPAIELFRYSPDQGTLADHLRQTEKKIEDAPFTDPPRRWMQSALTSGLREGNRQTAIGREGWLFFRPAIDALTGYGPLKPEPNTVAKNPDREPWSGPLNAIEKFNTQLESLGVELILVPIPVKPMIYPEGLGAGPGDGPLRHRDAEAFYAKLRGSGIEILDLADAWFADKAMGPVFLKQDTHWTPETMQSTARRVADFLKQRPWFGRITSEPGRYAPGTPVAVSASGDLLEKLDLPVGNHAFGQETTTITPVTDTRGGVVNVYDTHSPVVLLGDSFTNIFHQADMKWGEHAGFAEHLSLELGLSLDTIAQNGQASTGVRHTLASRPGAERMMREKKKAVVWAIAARDLFMSETAARDNKVRWDEVVFDSGDPEPDQPWPVEMVGTVTELAAIQDPKTAPYPESLFAVEYAVDTLISGDYAHEKALVLHWAFRKRELTPHARLKPGDRVRLTLESFDQAAQRDETLRGVNKATGTSGEFDLPPTWAIADDFTHGLATAEADAARIASAASTLFAFALGAAMVLTFRKQKALRAARAGA